MLVHGKLASFLCFDAKIDRYEPGFRVQSSGFRVQGLGFRV